MSLKSLQEQWLNKWEEMDKLVKPNGIGLAAPFFSVGVSSTTDRAVPYRTILLAGKATHRDWELNSFKREMHKPVSQRLEERTKCTIDFLAKKEHQTSSFWRFRRLLGPGANATVIWTNLSKIGVFRPPDETESINPWGPFLYCQKELAQKTLWAELAEYKPDLVVLVTGKEALDEIVDPVFAQMGRWIEGTANGQPFWFLNRSGKHPPVLRTGHPGFKSSNQREVWITKAVELLERAQ
jgi:hypothetical protein